MIPAFAVSRVRDENYDAVFALHERLFRPHIEKIWGWHLEWQGQNFRNNWTGCDTSVIEVDGELVGYQQVLMLSDSVLLKNLGLLPECQGRGIGAQLIRDLQALAAVRGLPITLSVFVTNPSAVRFYERLGFVKGDRSVEFQQMRWSPSAPASASA